MIDLSTVPLTLGTRSAAMARNRLGKFEVLRIYSMKIEDLCLFKDVTRS